MALAAHPVAAKPTPTPSPTPAGPPPPVLTVPAAGASLVQPIALGWNAVSNPNGPIGSYTWQVGTSATFTNITASGFTDMDSDPSIPTPTTDKVSGLPNGTYFWRVKATQLTQNGGVDSAWSAVRSFTVTGIGPAPAAPAFLTPANNAQFHLIESYKISWTAVTNAQYYVLEADDEPTFSQPLTLSQSPITFGTQFGGLWGNALTAYYRVRAVSADGVRSLPSATLIVKITDTAPVPAAVSEVSPAAGATVQLPFLIDWTDTPNPQVPGYEVEFNTSPTFGDTTSALLVEPSRSDYMISRDLLAPGSYYWRVHALHGNVAGPWSAARAITVTAGPTPPDVNLFAMITEPGDAYEGNPTTARLMLDNPAPAGGAVVTLSTDIPQAQMPVTTVTIPAGQTDARISPIATGPVPNNGLSIGIIGDVYAGFGSGSVQNSLGVLPILYGIGFSKDSVVGGDTFTGTVTLLSAAPAGGVTVRIVSSNTSLVNPPATVFIPAGGTGADFQIFTSTASVPTRVTIDTGTDIEGFRAPQVSVVVTPPGAPASAPNISSLTLSASAIPAGGTVTGTVTLTAPAPAGGAVVNVDTPIQGQDPNKPATITIPAGSLSGTFTTTPAAETNVVSYELIQVRYGTGAGLHARVLEVDPAAGPATLLAIGPAGQEVIGGNPGRGSVGLMMPAPAGGGVVTLTTDNPTYIQVPPSVSIAEGNSAGSFTITTNPVETLPTGGNVFATAGGVTKSIFVTVTPDPNAPPILKSVSIAPASVVGGTSATGTVFLNRPAPAGGLSATLAFRIGVAVPPAVVTIPAGQLSVNFPITTTTVTTTTVDTITAFIGASSQSANITVTKAGAPTPTPTPTPTVTPPPTPTPTPTATPPKQLPSPTLISPAADARFAPGSNITFDWSDVTGAANYTFQVDDQDTFTTPLIVDQVVATSQFSTSTLPTKTMWFRARANDASGNPGVWSAVRKFEVKK